MEHSYLSKIDPFVTSYPILTTRGRPTEAFELNEGFFIKYIIKLKPRTMGDFIFEVKEVENSTNPGTLNPTGQFKLCLLKITHIGENYPCTEAPGAEVKDSDSVEINSNPGCGVDGSIKFPVRV